MGLEQVYYSLENVQTLESNLSQIRERDQILGKTKIFIPEQSPVIQTPA